MLMCMIFAFLIYKAYLDGRTDHELAKQGVVSPRLQAKYGAKAADQTARYGFGDYLKDAWSDAWASRTERRRVGQQAAATVAPKPGRSKASWWARLKAGFGAAKAWTRDAAAKVAEKATSPAGKHRAADPATPLKRAAGNVDTERACPDCGERLSRQGGGWWHPDGPSCSKAAKPDPRQPEPAQPTTRKEKPVTAPTGEAVNYETTVAELEANIALARTWLEQVTAALKDQESAKNHISDGQDAYRPVANAVPTMLDFLTSKNLDGTTLGLIGAIKDAMPASDLDAALAAIEEAEEILKTLVANAQTALDALEAALAHVQATYSTAEETVQGQLGGDSSFLGSGATTSAAA